MRGGLGAGLPSGPPKAGLRVRKRCDMTHLHAEKRVIGTVLLTLSVELQLLGIFWEGNIFLILPSYYDAQPGFSCSVVYAHLSGSYKASLLQMGCMQLFC